MQNPDIITEIAKHLTVKDTLKFRLLSKLHAKIDIKSIYRKQWFETHYNDLVQNHYSNNLVLSPPVNLQSFYETNGVSIKVYKLLSMYVNKVSPQVIKKFDLHLPGFRRGTTSHYILTNNLTLELFSFIHAEWLENIINKKISQSYAFHCLRMIGF